MYAPGRRCIRRCGRTKARAAAGLCPSWSVRWFWWRWSGCPAARGGASREFCGCGGMVLRKPRQTWSLSGVRTSGASTWSTPSAFSNRLWDGPRRGCATPSRPTGGRGWWWPLSPRAQAGAGVRCGPKAAVGEALRHRSPNTDPGPPRRFGAFARARHACEAAETLRKIARKAQRPPLFWPSQTLPGLQEGRLSPRRWGAKEFCDELYVHRKTTRG